MFSLVVFMHRAVNIPRKGGEKKKRKKKILPQSLNFVMRTKCPFSELHRPFVPMAFIFRLYNN